MSSRLSILVLLAFVCSLPKFSAESSRKELGNKDSKQETTIQLGHSIQSSKIDPSQVVQLSWRPRVFLYKGFLSDDECDHLILLAQGRKETASGNDDNSGQTVTKQLVASLETPLDAKDGIVASIEEKISTWTFLPKGNGKQLEVMHYEREDAKQNFDYFGSQSAYLNHTLMATVVLYLSNVTRGGEILFPNCEPNSKIWSDCTTKSSSITKPTKGNAILFFTHQPNASPDSSSSHARCPVAEGEMWCATKFFLLRATSGQNVPFESDTDECSDEDENCSAWAALGECQKNPLYMIGSPDYYGTCRKSCNAC